MRVIIDRFEGDTAVVELDGETMNAPRALFAEAKEGDAVVISVVGKPDPDGEDSPRSVFERLRRKKRA